MTTLCVPVVCTTPASCIQKNKNLDFMKSGFHQILALHFVAVEDMTHIYKHMYVYTYIYTDTIFVYTYQWGSRRPQRLGISSNTCA